MAGLFGNGILGAYQQQGDPQIVGILSALKDAGAYLGGGGSTDNFAKFQQQNQQSQAVGQLVSGLQSDDPATRQQAYAIAPLFGVDPSAFQKQRAAQALPQLLTSMKPHQENVAALQLDNGASTPAFDYQAPGLSFTDAIAQSNSPELTAQYGDEVVKQMMAGPKFQEVGGGLYELPKVSGEAPTQVIAPALKAPTTRTVRMGSTDVTQEFDTKTGQWREVGRGAAFKPEAALTPPDPKAVDLGVQYFMQYGKLPPTARTPSLQMAIMASASDRLAAQGKSMEDVIRTAQNNRGAGDTIVAFDKGKQGDTVRSLNVSVQHLDTLRELGTALKNGDVNLINAARQKFAEQFGVAAPTNWDAAKAIVADEVAKGVIGGQTAQSDRETLAATLNRARSPEQAEGAINTFQDLLGGQLRGLRQQYKSSTGRDDFNNKLFPETVRRLDPVRASPASLPQKGAAKIRVFNPATGRLE